MTHSDRVRHLESSLVRVVEKTQGLQELLKTIRDVFASRLPLVNRALIRHLETVQRDYMWNFVALHWEKFGDTPDRTSLAYLLARRLAMSLSGESIKQLTQDLGGPIPTQRGEGLVHPMQYYVMPPVERMPLAGDLYSGKIVDTGEYWVLLTPSCDMVIGREKAERVLMTQCFLLTEQEEYNSWQLELSNQRREGKIKSLLRNNRKDRPPERFFFLPGCITLPDLVVDFQHITTIPRDNLNNLERLASLDNPFGEALLSRFARYFGRIGSPDLDVDYVLALLKQQSS